MPSRLQATAILAFWLATTAWVGYREVWPRFFSDAPPPVYIDLADEVTQRAATRWAITRDGKTIGSMTTRMERVEADDTYRFVSSYSNLKLDAGEARGAALTFFLPRLETAARVDRAGVLREQSLSGEISLSLGPVELGTGSADVTGVVVGRELQSRCVVRYPASAKAPTLERDLDPVPVPEGQVLNPLTPVNRLQNVTPGRRWVIREINPLLDAVMLLAREGAKDSPRVVQGLLAPSEGRELLAEVLRTPETVTRPGGEEVSCWVIEYRAGDVTARTWVSRADGRVMRQRAAGVGEPVQFDRLE